jgi:transposase
LPKRTALSNDLRWHLHDLWPETTIPLRALTATGWQTRIAARLGRAEQSARVRIARDELRRIRELTRAINELHAELGTLVAALAPRLLAERGCGVLTAAKLLGEIADVTRFTSDARLARAAGTAPIPASSGRTQRDRSTTAATARSTARCTASPSPKAAWTPRAPPTSPAAKPKARPAAKPSAASNATSPAGVWHLLHPTRRPPSPPALQAVRSASSRSTATGPPARRS